MDVGDKLGNGFLGDFGGASDIVLINVIANVR